jgi:hypothetical protein
VTGPTPASSAVVLRIDGQLAPRLVASGFRFPLPCSCTSPATRCVDKRHEAATARRRPSLARRSSTDQDLVVIHSLRQWPAARFVCAFVCAPTDAGAAAEHADRAVPSLVARSPENAFPPAASESNPRRAGHVSVSEAPPLESWLDGRPGIRSPTLGWVRRLTCLSTGLTWTVDTFPRNRAPQECDGPQEWSRDGTNSPPEAADKSCLWFQIMGVQAKAHAKSDPSTPQAWLPNRTDPFSINHPSMTAICDLARFSTLRWY